MLSVSRGNSFFASVTQRENVNRLRFWVFDARTFVYSRLLAVLKRGSRIQWRSTKRSWKLHAMMNSRKRNGICIQRTLYTYSDNEIQYLAKWPIRPETAAWFCTTLANMTAIFGTYFVGRIAVRGERSVRAELSIKIRLIVRNPSHISEVVWWKTKFPNAKIRKYNAVYQCK